MIALDVQANGTIEKWKVGGSNKKNSAVNGWDKNTLKPGDVITGIGFRFKDGSNAAQLQKIVMANGKEMSTVYGQLRGTSGRGSDVHRQRTASVDRNARYLPSQFGGFGLGDSAQLKLSPTRRIIWGRRCSGSRRF